MGKRPIAVLGLSCCAALAPARAADFSGEFALGQDSNVANVREGGRERSDRFALLAAGVDRPWRLSDSSTLLWRPQLEAQQFDDCRGLSSLQLGLQARWLYRPGAGFHVPVLELLAGATAWEFDSRLRDGAQYRFGVFASAPLTTRIGLRAGAQLRQRRADSAVFDTDVRMLGADLDWELRPGSTLYLGYQHLDGDLVSTAPTAPAASDAVAPDDVFDGETAFRLDSRADIGTLGLNHALSPQLALDLQGRGIRARAETGARYERRQLLLSLLWRW
ncbi:hypothetical protein C3942_10570 [Solimonas fluminis]|uniref:Outer membrane protein beta-barrel domain-containing protein n=1 Tax=Solimonas fluminis TaxID=2086571 RepID=A0A2S5TFS5_9GAMM|nr:hypothetical protein [Solimonas fluminis]PPE73840.1 hypothetical protein C3942_10570 [Solimonas fluminis]